MFVRDLTCNDHVEKLYYSLDHEAICVYCSEPIEGDDMECPNYPQCAVCKDMTPVHRLGTDLYFFLMFVCTTYSFFILILFSSHTPA